MAIKDAVDVFLLRRNIEAIDYDDIDEIEPIKADKPTITDNKESDD